MKSITVDSIIQEFGDYYLNHGQKLADIKHGLVAAPAMLQVPGIIDRRTDETVYRMSETSYQPVLQPYQHKFTAKGGVTFHPNEIRLRQMKIDLLLQPDVIEDNWLGFLAGKDTKEIEKWPIVRYIMEVYIPTQLALDKEMNVVYKGKYKAPSDGVAGNPADSMDGFKEALLKASTAENPLNKLSGIGALTIETAYDQIEQVRDMLPGQYLKHDMVLFCAPEFEMAYLKKKRDLNQYDYHSDGQIHTRVDFSKIIVKGCDAMAGTTDMFLTLPGNMIHCHKRSFETSKIDLQKMDRDVKALISWWEGVGFGCNADVFTTDETVAVQETLNAEAKTTEVGA